MRTTRCSLAARVLLGSVALLAGTAHADRTPLANDLWVEIIPGERPFPESIRSEFRFDLLANLEESRCYRSVSIGSPAPPVDDDDLVLRIFVREVEEQIDYDLSLAARDTSDDPTAGRRYAARFRAVLAGQLRTGAEDRMLQEKSWSRVAVRRPLQFEDAREAAALELIDLFVRDIRRFACGPNAKKLQRLIERSKR